MAEARERPPHGEDEDAMAGAMAVVPRVLAILVAGSAPMLALAVAGRLKLLDVAAVPVPVMLAVLALACLSYLVAMTRASGSQLAAAVLGFGVPLVLYYFSSRGGPGVVVAAFVLVTVWIVSIIASASFSTLGEKQ